MKAALLERFKTPLRLVELPDPTPGPGEAVVRVLAIPVLLYLREVFEGTRNHPLLLPLVPGCGAIGSVESLGAMQRNCPGERWFFATRRRVRGTLDLSHFSSVPFSLSRVVEAVDFAATSRRPFEQAALTPGS